MARKLLSFSGHSMVEEPTVNLTPLIDVVFVILIMFIVIAPLLELDRVDLAEGPPATMASSQFVKESSPMMIHVHPDNTIWFNHQRVTPTELATQLKQAKTRFPQEHPQVFLDKQSHFGVYQAVKNAAEEAGFSYMDIILKPA